MKWYKTESVAAAAVAERSRSCGEQLPVANQNQSVVSRLSEQEFKVPYIAWDVLSVEALGVGPDVTVGREVTLQLRRLPDQGHETLGRVLKDLPCDGVHLVEDARSFQKLLDEPGRRRAVDLGKAEERDEVDMLDLQAKVSMPRCSQREQAAKRTNSGATPWLGSFMATRRVVGSLRCAGWIDLSIARARCKLQMV